MNKKGFTLVELIAVIVILALLALIANSSVVNVVKNSKSDLYNAQLKLIESAAESWGNDNLDKLPNDGECKYLTLANLKNYGLMEEEIINPKTNKEFSDDLYIKITSKINSSGMLKTTYKVDDSVNGCTEALPPVCTLALDSEKTGLENGAKYNCKVKETMEVEYPNGYTFYVLGKNEDGTINLIMDRNVYYDSITGTSGLTNINNLGLVAWNSSGSNTGGPIDAIIYLYNATKNWENIPVLNYKYYDRKVQGITENNLGYTSFISRKGIGVITTSTEEDVTIGTNLEPLRARIPIISEIKSFDTNNGYLYEYLDSNVWDYEGNGRPINKIDGIWGYWSLSSFNNIEIAWSVGSGGTVGGARCNNLGGVRPVITLHNYQIR